VRCDRCLIGPAKKIPVLISSLSTKVFDLPFLFKKPFQGSYSEMKTQMRKEGIVDTECGPRKADLINTAKRKKVERPKWLSAADDAKIKITATDEQGE